MILKSFELNKLKLNNKKNFLFYGENQGQKNEIIEKFEKSFTECTYRYEEAEVLNDLESFFNNILSQSFFEKEKLIIINRTSDKILNIIEEIIEKQISDITLILNASSLDKKSKLRSFFEKNKETVCVPFYKDNNQTLTTIVIKFFRENKMPISQQSINLIIERCRGDRQNLHNELEKIFFFSRKKNKVEVEDILKITNLAENYDAAELVDSCLSKNKKKTINILNENNYSIEDCILIIRTFLIKSKRLIKLCKNFKDTKDIDTVISDCKPPIFWKDKDIIKQQVKNWSLKNAEDLTYEINEIELLIKKHSKNSINILSNFIIAKTISISN